MAAYNKFQQFVEDLAHKVHDLENDQLKVALTATANAPVATNSVLLDLTEITYTNLSSTDITTNSSGQTGGTYTLSLVDLTLSASGGAVEAFQYVVVYNDTPAATPTDPLISWFDYGSALTLNDGESLTIDFASDGGPNGNLLTLT
jgi:hypothetical protein